MQKQTQISQKKLQKKIGTVQLVLIDSHQGDRAIARSKSAAPEIDGVVFIEKGAALIVGEFAMVKIIAADDYDLYAALV